MQNQEFISLKYVTYTQPIWVALRTCPQLKYIKKSHSKSTIFFFRKHCTFSFKSSYSLQIHKHFSELPKMLISRQNRVKMEEKIVTRMAVFVDKIKRKHFVYSYWLHGRMIFLFHFCKRGILHVHLWIWHYKGLKP